MGDSYPYDWIQTLEAAEKLDFDQVIGGHADVMVAKKQFDLWNQYLSDLMAQTAQSFAHGDTESEAEKQVSGWLLARYRDKFITEFPQGINANVAKALQVISQP
jgi:hypothetical protein